MNTTLRACADRLLAAALAFAAMSAFPGCATVGTDPAPVRVGDGVYLIRGSAGLATPANRGRIGNAGFIVGDSGVLVVDTGTSLEQGRAILAAVRQVTDKPVRLALITHTQPDFLFGAAAFQAAGIPVQMHVRASRLMASRCETCLKNLRLTLGEAEMRGTTTFKPDREFDATQTSEVTGRTVQILYFGHSSGPGDVAVFDPRSGVLFAGGLADQQRIPDILDADLAGWHRALAALLALNPAVVVPGHGPASGPSLVTTVERYLTQLESRARSLVESGVSLIDVTESLQLPEFSAWDQYDTLHARNASIAYLRFERELFVK
jgi:glyoxylase-like metal-dependent hydrolase (beta-lactamase superfamily II)